MSDKHQTWLNQTIEKPLDPQLPICDPHHHLWDTAESRYLLDELLADVNSGHNITQTVFVQTQRNIAIFRKDGIEGMGPVAETELAQRIAAEGLKRQSRTRAVAGIVARADLALGDRVAPVLEAHIAAGKGLVRGIRQTTAIDPVIRAVASANSITGLLLDSNFREGFKYLRRNNLSYDSLIYYHQLMELVDLAKAFPDTTIILNHVGCPLGAGPYADKQEDVVREWKRGITELAACPNVFVKLGGFGMAYFGFGWSARPKPPYSAEVAKAIAPYVSWCIAKFGVKRCMFESNFPVDKESYSYTVIWNAFKRFSKGFSAGEKSFLFHDTAVKVYRLAQE